MADNIHNDINAVQHIDFLLSFQISGVIVTYINSFVKQKLPKRKNSCKQDIKPLFSQKSFVFCV